MHDNIDEYKEAFTNSRDEKAKETDIETAYYRLLGVKRAYINFLFVDVERGQISASDAKDLCEWMDKTCHAFRMTKYDGE